MNALAAGGMYDDAIHGAGLITGSYDIPAVWHRARATFSHTTPTQAYRSSGRPEVNFALERIIDMASDKLGFDKIELRRKNLVSARAFPYTNGVGAVYDSGEYETNMDWSMRLAGWEERHARRADGGRAERTRNAARFCIHQRTPPLSTTTRPHTLLPHRHRHRSSDHYPCHRQSG